MIVCHCFGVNDREIRKAVAEGARSCRQVRRACKAGGDCRGCVPHVKMILQGMRRDAAASSSCERAAG